MIEELTAEEYQRFRYLLENISGIKLGTGKEYLVRSRLRRLLEKESFGSFSELMVVMKLSRRLQEKVIDAMTVNETLWFRDEEPYRIFREKLLPEMAKLNRPLRVWSAACSTGQEPYSLSMEIEEYKKQFPGKLMAGERILATDISPTSLAIAKEGVYQQLSIQRGMNEDYLRSYFDKDERGHWHIKENIKSRVEFRSQNLQQSYALLGKFDIIFCRNVLIYFSADLKQDILTRMHACLNPGGYLMLGSSEIMNNLSAFYETVKCRSTVVYKAKKLDA